MSEADYKTILVSREGAVATVTLNRPDKLNALNMALMDELVDALEQLDADADIRAIIITGSGNRAFAAGADIGEMADATVIEMLQRNQFAKWDRIRRISKPLIAAVNGFALGGGNELVMLCDIIVAGETAQFGQPEVNIGVMPGAGGTQRLTRRVGKYIAMEMVLAGRTLSAREALLLGYVNHVVPVEAVMDEARRIALEIAAKSPLAVRLAKEAVLRSFDTTIEGGLEFERKNFYLLFASDDKREGMQAFLEKRKPKFSGK
jgi:enoyl-CoA hydratase